MLPSTGRLAGIDFGTRRVGVALCDAGRKFTGPHAVYERVSDAADAVWFARLVREEGIVGFVVGLPLHTSGEENAKCREARDFAAWLTAQTKLPCEFCDERYTSHAAEHLLAGMELTKQRRKARLDALAAQMILETYLAAQNPDE